MIFQKGGLMTRVYINGVNGRMGQAAAAAVEKDEALTFVGGGDAEDSLADRIRATKPEVVLDFTVASAVEQNARAIIENGVVPVIGTSGVTSEIFFRLKTLAEGRGIGGIVVPNFAIGAVLMMMFAQKAAEYLPDVEIIEEHHDGKQDAPSGTAVRTAELIAQVRRQAQPDYQPRVALDDRSISVAGIGIHSLRLPGLVAHQEVVFGGHGQVLRIRHDSMNRDSFMPGVCLACRKATGLKELVYGLEYLL